MSADIRCDRCGTSDFHMGYFCAGCQSAQMRWGEEKEKESRILRDQITTLTERIEALENELEGRKI